MPCPPARRMLAAIALMALIPTARPALAAWPHDVLVNVPVAPSTGPEYPQQILPDGAGGTFIFWTDTRFGGYDIYAQHLTAAATAAPGWPAGGMAVCTAGGDQVEPKAIVDGNGGIIIAWTDHRGGAAGDIYAIRVTGAGMIAPGWPLSGRLLLANANDELHPSIVSDGVGGALVAWEYAFSATDHDIYGARVDGNGNVLWANAIYQPLGNQLSPLAVSDGAGGMVIGFGDDVSGNLDIKVVRCSAAGALVWGPVTMCGAANDQFNEVATSDGAGGIIMAWKDDRSGVQHDIYAGRVTISGSVALGWLTDGNPVCKASGTKDNPAIASDGAGGAFVAWSDYRFSPSEPDIFALRILPGGNQPFGWPIDGQAITTSSGSQYERGLVSDGAGGAIIVWEDTRVDPGYSDVFASRVLPNGAAAPGWLNGGTPLCTAGNFQRFPVICTDGAGGAIVAWTDSRTGTPKAYAQNVDLFGQLGDARPTSAGIKDVKADQGGHVRMTWNASYLDANPLYAVSSYWIWRQTPASVAAAAVSDGGAWADVPSARSDAVVADAPPHAARLFRHADDATAGYAWEFVSSQPSNGSLQYSFVAPTVSDSVAGYNPYTVFMVEARGTSNGTFWDSSPDSAYSVDNLPPFTPAPFTANFSVGVTHLHWGRNLEPDLANYRLYRGRSAAFVPGASNLVASPADTGYADMAPPDSYYKLSAVDAHGNESDFALVSPPAGLDVNDHPALVLALARPAPNPARSAPRIGFSLAHDTHVSLSIYDIAGRRERTLVEGLLPAGEHAQVWDLRDASGAIVHDGLYLVRMEADGKRFTERLIVAQ